MTSDKNELSPEELESQRGGPLPDKEAASLIGDVTLNLGDVMLDVNAPISADVGVYAPINADVGVYAPIDANVYAPIDANVFAPIDANVVANVAADITANV